MTKFKKYFIFFKMLKNCLLSFIFIFNLIFGLNQNCINPTIQELETKYYHYRIDFLRFEQAMFKAGKFPHSDFKGNNLLNASDSCLIGEKSRSKKNEICFSQINVEFLPNRYPNYKINVQCDCRFCSTVKNVSISSNYECQPVYKRYPILMKSDCASDNFYEWIPTTEIINTGCACGLNKIFIPF